MRPRACLGGALLLCSACAQLPNVVRVEVDGTTVEIKKPSPPSPQVDTPAAQVPEADGRR